VEIKPALVRVSRHNDAGHLVLAGETLNAGGAMAYVIAIDIGGTFTDAFAADESGRVAGTKAPSTPRRTSHRVFSPSSMSWRGHWVWRPGSYWTRRTISCTAPPRH